MVGDERPPSVLSGAALSGLPGSDRPPSVASGLEGLPPSHASTGSLQGFSRRGQSGGSGSVGMLLAKLEDPDAGVRLEATKALSQLATKEDPEAVAGLLGRFPDSNQRVRTLAVRALSQVSERGDGAVVPGLLEYLRHDTWYVRQAAASSLGRLAMKNDACVSERLVGCLLDEREDVVQASLEALGAVARRGDAEVVAALLGRLEAECGWLTKRDTAQALLHGPAASSNEARAAAASLLGSLGGDGAAGNHRVVAALLVHVGRPAENWLVRKTALESLGKVSPKGDADVLAALVSSVSDKDPGVRQAAVGAMATVAARGREPRVVSALLAVLETPGELPFMRTAAVKTLGQA